MHTVNRINKFTLILVATFISLAAVQAQTKTITGIVTNDGGIPYAGARVCSVMQSNTCVETNQKGEYSIVVPVAETTLTATLSSPYECQSTTMFLAADNKANAQLAAVVCP